MFFFSRSWIRTAIALLTLSGTSLVLPAVAADPSPTGAAVTPSPEPSLLPNPEGHCDGASVNVYYVDGRPVGGVLTLFGYDGYSSEGYSPLIPLNDVATFLHAKASIIGDRGRLSGGGKVLEFALHSRKVWLNGTPAGDAETISYKRGGILYVSGDLAARFLGSTNDAIVTTDYVPPQPNGKPFSVPVECRPLHVTAAESAVVAAAKLPFPARKTPGPFCGGATPFDIFTVRSYARPREAFAGAVKARADAELCNENYAAAARTYASIRAGYEADVGGGSDKPEFERRYNVAREMSDTPPAVPAPGLMAESHAFVNGDVCKAMRAYAADEANYSRDGDQVDDYQKRGPSPELKLTVDATCRGDLVSAQAHMAKVTGDAASLYDLMRGALYARRHDWYRAAAAWWSAAGDYPEMAAMEQIEISQYQDEALALIYYYRAHIRYV